MRGGGRKNLKQGALQGSFDLKLGQTIRRVVVLRGSNIIEVEDAESLRTLCFLPAKFNKVLWIRKGSFVVVEEGEREKVLESGNKVTGMICQVLFEEQVRSLKRNSMWPSGFEDIDLQAESSREGLSDNNDILRASNSDGDSSEDKGLPPLETNPNRRAVKFESSSDEED